MSKKVLIWGVGILFLLILQNTFRPIAAAQAPNITVDTVVASGFNQPVGVYSPGDGSGRLFVVEQGGNIKIIKNGVVLSTPFLNLDPDTQVLSGGERGLLGLAFHPNFKRNGYFFVNYTRRPDGATVIARYRVSANPDVADPSSAAVVLTIGQPFANHNGGHLAFGKDGYLYIGMGDGGGAGDPNHYAQSDFSLLGKMLRIDVDHPDPNRLYSIPPGNYKDEIWAKGLRNPWFWSFDRLTGDLYIGDVGQNKWEEVDYWRFTDPPNANFGWSCLEGTHDYNLTRYPCNDPTKVAQMARPIAEYSHAEGQSITGGYVYRGNLYPNLYGRYFYADFSTGKIWSLEKTSDQPLTFSSPVLHLDSDFLISCFGEDENGELYVCDYSGGTIRRLEDTSGAVLDLSQSTLRSDPVYANSEENVTYTLSLKNGAGSSGGWVTATINIPSGLTLLSASAGVTVNVNNPSQLIWQGFLSPGASEIITFTVRVNIAQGNPITTVQISSDGNLLRELKHALLIPKPVLLTTAEDFRLPGTQPGALVDPIMLPATCDVCHTAMIYNAWQGSMMSLAGRDPLFWAALEVANHDAPGSGEYCLRCHTPKAWLEGRSASPDGSMLTPADLDAGVSCEVCHRAVDPVPSSNPNDQARSRDQTIRSGLGGAFPSTHIGSGMMIFDPEDFRRGPFDLGVNFGYHPNQTYRSDFLGGNPNDPVARSRLCGSCHNVDNPILSWNPGENEYLPNAMGSPAPSLEQDALFAVETTYDEWLYSGFSETTACQDCHMPRTTGYAAEPFLNSVFRDCGVQGCLPVHEFVGGNTWVPQLLQDPQWRLSRVELGTWLKSTVQKARAMLQRAARVSLTFQPGAGAVTVRVTNLAGHKLPTGYAEGRRMWLRIIAFDEAGNEVFSTCNYNLTTGELEQDAHCVVFEVQQAVSAKMATALNGTVPVGPSFHFLLNNGVFKDNRIPPAGFRPEAFTRPGLMPMENGQPSNLYAPGQNYFEKEFIVPSSAVRVQVFLYYQTASKEYIDFLASKGGVDAQTLLTLWQGNKNPPELMAWDAYPKFTSFLTFISR